MVTLLIYRSASVNCLESFWISFCIWILYLLTQSTKRWSLFLFSTLSIKVCSKQAYWSIYTAYFCSISSIFAVCSCWICCSQCANAAIFASLFVSTRAFVIVLSINTKFEIPMINIGAHMSYGLLCHVKRRAILLAKQSHWLFRTTHCGIQDNGNIAYQVLHFLEQFHLLLNDGSNVAHIICVIWERPIPSSACKNTTSFVPISATLLG